MIKKKKNSKFNLIRLRWLTKSIFCFYQYLLPNETFLSLGFYWKDWLKALTTVAHAGRQTYSFLREALLVLRLLFFCFKSVWSPAYFFFFLFSFLFGKGKNTFFFSFFLYFSFPLQCFIATYIYYSVLLRLKSLLSILGGYSTRRRNLKRN